jgi:hypothetical protein
MEWSEKELRHFTVATVHRNTQVVTKRNTQRHLMLCQYKYIQIGMCTNGFTPTNVPGIWLPLKILHAITGDAVPFWWGYTEQQAFEDVKELVQAAREH